MSTCRCEHFSNSFHRSSWKIRLIDRIDESFSNDRKLFEISRHNSSGNSFQCETNRPRVERIHDSGGKCRVAFAFPTSFDDRDVFTLATDTVCVQWKWTICERFFSFSSLDAPLHFPRDLLNKLRRARIVSSGLIEQCCKLRSANSESPASFLLFILSTFIREKNEERRLNIFQSAKILCEETNLSIERLGELLWLTNISKEKLQQQVDVLFTKKGEAKFVDVAEETPSSGSILRSLRHRLLQARLLPNQLQIVIKQGGWSNEVGTKFRRKWQIVEWDNALELIRHITEQISVILRENGGPSDERLLIERFREH